MDAADGNLQKSAPHLCDFLRSADAAQAHISYLFLLYFHNKSMFCVRSFFFFFFGLSSVIRRP